MTHVEFLKKVIEFARENRKQPDMLYIDSKNLRELLCGLEAHICLEVKGDEYWYCGLRVVQVAEKKWCEVA